MEIRRASLGVVACDGVRPSRVDSQRFDAFIRQPCAWVAGRENYLAAATQTEHDPVVAQQREARKCKACGERRFSGTSRADERARSVIGQKGGRVDRLDSDQIENSRDDAIEKPISQYLGKNFRVYSAILYRA